MTNRDLSAFDDFCRFAVSCANHHWQPQIKFLPDRLDFVGRIENMDVALSQIASRVEGFDPTDVRSNQTNSSADPRAYRQYYSKESRDIVSDFYRDDINMVGDDF
jgi:hypothetical protein